MNTGKDIYAGCFVHNSGSVCAVTRKWRHPSGYNVLTLWNPTLHLQYDIGVYDDEQILFMTPRQAMGQQASSGTQIINADEDTW